MWNEDDAKKEIIELRSRLNAQEMPMRNIAEFRMAWDYEIKKVRIQGAIDALMAAMERQPSVSRQLRNEEEE